MQMSWEWAGHGASPTAALNTFTTAGAEVSRAQMHECLLLPSTEQWGASKEMGFMIHNECTQINVSINWPAVAPVNHLFSFSLTVLLKYYMDPDSNVMSFTFLFWSSSFATISPAAALKLLCVSCSKTRAERHVDGQPQRLTEAETWKGNKKNISLTDVQFLGLMLILMSNTNIWYQCISRYTHLLCNDPSNEVIKHL